VTEPVLLRSGGLLLIDNVLCNGQVVDSAFDDADTLAIRYLNEKFTPFLWARLACCQ
jgi:predicted O-methyltransferase YrrM